MEETSTSVEHEGFVHSRPTRNQTGFRSNTERFGPVVFSLVLVLSVLLLAGLIRQGFLYHSAAAELSTIKANLTDLIEERNQLKINNTEMQKLLNQKKTCPAGWKMFNSSCYLLSRRTGTWTEGRDNCRRKDAHLVVIETREEQTFISGFINQDTWIGLSDRDQEGTWIWIDGTPLTSTSARFWARNQPDNSGNAEDCGHIRADTAQWNDLPCLLSRHWICEKDP